MNITIWNEFVHEQQQNEAGELCRQHYPEGIHAYLKAALGPKLEGATIRLASLDMPENGLPEDVLNSTDVLLWWGHMAHGQVPDALAERVQNRVLAGMGLIVLHSGHLAKPFRRLLGTPCSLRWREIGEKERVWVCDPAHPIARGIPDSFEIAQTEMYGEPFGIPDDGHVVFMSWYQGGNVFRSGVTFQRSLGRVFYFSPGHETLPIYHNPHVQQVLLNAIQWCAPQVPVVAPPACTHDCVPVEPVG